MTNKPTNKSLIGRMVEAIDDYAAERRAARATSVPTPKTGSKAWRAILPSPGNVLFSTLLVGALLLANRAGALSAFMPASPQTSTSTIAYQGRLANSGGTPLTGLYPMVFRLYDQAAGSAPLWEETWTGPNSVRVSDGLFNVMLGSLAPMQPALIVSNSSLWLGITVGVDGEMSPRVQLGTVPYAMQALTVPDGSITAPKISSHAITADALADLVVGTTKLGERSVTDSKLMTGSISTDKLADAAVTSRKLKPTTGIVNLHTDHMVTVPSTYANVAIPETQFAFSLDQPSRVLIWYSLVAWTRIGSEYGTFVRIAGPSGSTDHSVSVQSGDWFKTYGSVALVDLPAGAYTGEARAFSAYAGATMTFTANSGFVMHMVLSQ